MFRVMLLTIASAACAVASAVEIRFKAPENVNELVQQYIELEVDEADADDPTVRDTLLHQARDDVRELLATEGYFTPTVRWGDRLLITIETGPATEIGDVDLRVSGPVESARIEQLKKQWTLTTGMRFTQQRWDEAKQNLLRNLTDRDFPAARIVDSKALIEPEHLRANLSVHIDSGPAYVYGPLQIKGLDRYRSTQIDNYAGSLSVGEPYRREELLRLQNDLQNTPYFATVDVRIVPTEQTAVLNTDPDYGAIKVSAPVEVFVVERAPHRISFGVGASSDAGARAQINYSFPDLFGRAWDFSTGLKIEQKQQSLYADLFFPRPDADTQDSVGVVFRNEEFENLQVFSQTYRATRAVIDNRLETRYALTLENSIEQPAGQAENSRLALVPSVTYIWRLVDNLRMPRHGGNYLVDVAAASEELVSDTSFAYVDMRAQYFLTFADDWTLILRAELGGNFAVDNDEVPQRYLFRTGGSNSVRGYDYQSIGVLDGTTVVGARRLVVASAELNYWFDDYWAAAVFYDAGDAKNSISELEWNYGYGIGARYATPAGPIALDIAQGDDDGDIRYHFAVSIPF